MDIGGNTAKHLYQHWAVTHPWDHKEVTYFFGDERCVPPYHQESDYGMFKQSLFPTGIPECCTIKRMKGELFDQEAAANNYENMLRNPWIFYFCL